MPLTRRRMGSLLLKVLGVTLLLAAGFLAVTPTGRYLARAGWEEAKILRGRRSIDALASDPGLDPVVRAKLQMVRDARNFARDSVGLKTEESFTQYTQLDRDTLVLLVQGARKDRLEQKTWWFPIVGSVPYKGFFDFGAARKLGAQLEQGGYDVYLRPASAFSTLGYFNDPLLSTTLRLDSLDLASTVIHEVTHNTFYAKGEAVFNESFAEFVGARGAIWFFRSRGQDSAAAEVERRWMDEKLMADFWAHLYRRVDSAFAAHPGDDSTAIRRRLAVRDTVYGQARRFLVDSIGPRLQTIDRTRLERIRLDNAVLMARRVYATELDLFDQVWLREGMDLRRAMARIVELAEDEEEPYDALRRWVAQAR